MTGTASAPPMSLPRRAIPTASWASTAMPTMPAVKAAHRKLVVENHPDRLVAQGMPPEFVEMANEKLAKINAAYDEIRKLRGIR